MLRLSSLRLVLAAVGLAPLALAQGMPIDPTPILQTYSGCVRGQYVPEMNYENIGQILSLNDCAVECDARGATGMMWYPGFNSWDCLCGSTAPDFGFYSGAFANYPESCNAASGVMYYTLGSPFVFQECWYSATMDQRDIDAGGQKGVVHDLSSCFALCSSWQYTFYGSNRDAEPPLCNCGNYPATDPDGAGTGCGMMNSFSFKQDAVVPEPSGEPARRRRRLAELERQQVLANNPYCPVGSQACRVAPGAGGYECLHTESELESCGGCRYGVHGGANATATGIDCTALPGVKAGGVTCSRGQCVVSACSKGFRRRGNRCV